jgi:hypothetical protein
MTQNVRSYVENPVQSIRACELAGIHIGKRVTIDVTADLTITDTLEGVFHTEEETRVRFKNAEPAQSFDSGFNLPAGARVVIL